MNIAITALVLFGVFAVLLILGCPISISIAISSIATTLVNLPWDQTSFIVMQKMNSGVESFSLLAVPLFILAAVIKNKNRHEQRRHCQKADPVRPAAVRTYSWLPGTYQCTGQHVLWRAVRFSGGGGFRYRRHHGSYGRGRRI